MMKHTQNSDLHASVIEIDSSIQQPSFGRNTAINNDNISPEQGDIANNYTELTDETIQGTKDSSSSATESRNQLNDQDQTTRNGDNSSIDQTNYHLRNNNNNNNNNFFI